MYLLNPDSNVHEGHYRLDDFDNPNSWLLSEIEMIREMGFEVDGDTHLSMKTDDIDERTEYKISKMKRYGYCLEINGRKYMFKTFKDMLKKIDEAGRIPVH
jgi:hypothetical protein